MSDEDFGEPRLSGKPARSAPGAAPTPPPPAARPATPAAAPQPRPAAPAARTAAPASPASTPIGPSRPTAATPVGAGAAAAAATTVTPPAPRPTGAPAGAAGSSVPPGTPTASGARPAAGRGSARSRGPRRARLQLRHIDPWTVLKFSCVWAIMSFFVWLIAVAVLYGVLQGAGVVSSINDTVTKINGTGSSAPITAWRVLGGAAILGVLNVILSIALATIGSVVYNLCADLVGGVEVTLSELES
ncbi:transmembrane protein DUF3566 [Jatrophihabitans sp. GAS493]|nr:transmembrane protein DUF3566 [Jatrophihabitans sp. GAS493]